MDIRDGKNTLITEEIAKNAIRQVDGFTRTAYPDKVESISHLRLECIPMRQQTGKMVTEYRRPVCLTR